MTDADFDGDPAEFGFEPAVSATGADEPGPRRERARRRRGSSRPGGSVPTGSRAGGLRRRIGASAVLVGALASMGGAYALFATDSGASSSGVTAQDVAAGREIYRSSCIVCHGANLEGVQGQGPSLISVGQAATYFQVITGRMPLAQQGAEADRKTPRFDEKQVEQLAAYVENQGGGPSIPEGSLRGPDSTIGVGGELFRLNCASCHGTTFKGAPLSAGKYAPSLNDATDKEIYAAMLSGPESMPVFNDNQLTPTQKKEIISYVQTLKASNDPGGNGIDRIGPVSEAIVIWVAGVGGLMLAILWIGARAR